METIHVKFDKLTPMASECNNSEPEINYEASQIVSSSVEQVATEPNSPVLNENADELVQEDVADFDGNVFYNAPPTPVFEEAESYSTYQDPLNMHELKMDNPNITIEEYIRLQEEKALSQGETFNWQTATVQIENEFPAIVYNDA
ncbi:hypothetical protein Tco_0836514 [Tanacetum coccineum]